MGCSASWSRDSEYWAEWNYDPMTDMLSVQVIMMTNMNDWVAIGFSDTPSMVGIITT